LDIIDTNNIIGMVAIPNPNINTAESIVLAVLNEANSAEYTKPHGNKPFIKPPPIIEIKLLDPKSCGILLKKLNEIKLGNENLTDNLFVEMAEYQRIETPTLPKPLKLNKTWFD
jgi:hypothetical protein